MTTHDAPAELPWTPWTLLDGLGPLLRIGLGQTDDEVCDTLVHLEQLGLMQFAYDGQGASGVPGTHGRRGVGPGAAR
jgi:hypothetical protein